MKTKPTIRLAFPLATAITALIAGSQAQAQQIYWLGTTNGNFNADNWTSPSGSAMVPALVPLNNDVLNFAPSETSFNDVAGSFTINNDLTLTGVSLAISDNSATGDFSISGNPISIGGSGIVSNVLTGTGTTLAFGGTGITLAAATSFNALFGALTINSPVDNGGNLLTVEGVGATSISGVITGGGGLSKINAGSLTLSSTNTYTGQTTVTQGTVTASAIDALGTGAALLVNGGTLGISTFNNTVGAVTLTSGSITGTTGVLTGTSFALESGTASAILAGGGAVTKTTAGSVTLSGTNTFSGQLTVENGTISIGTANNVSTSGPLGNSALPVILGKTGAQTGTLSYTGGTVTSSKPLTMATGGTGNISVTTSGTSLTLSGLINGSGALSKSGSGTLILTGATNSYSGGTIINGGTLTAATDAVLGTGGGITFEASATFTPGAVTYARSITLNNGAIASFNGSNPTFSGNVTGTGGVSNLNNFGNQVNLSGTGNTFEGQVRIGSGGTTGQAYRFQFSSLADSATANGTIRFSASRVTHADGSVFQWNGSTNLTLANRQIELASATGSPSNGHQIRSSGTGTVTINTNLIASGGSPQVLALRGSNTGNNNFAGVISNSTVVGTTPLTVAFSAGATTVTLASVQGISIGATISGTGIDVGTTITAIDPSTRVVTLSTAAIGAGTAFQIMTVPGVLNPTSITKNTDAGTWTLSGNNTHSGGTSFSTGKLNINHAGALGTGTLTIGAGTFDNTSGSAITNANNNAIAWNGDATFTGTNSLDLGTGNVTMGGNRNIVVSGSTLTMGGVVSGAFGITLGGNGTMVLTGANTYTGKTSIGNNVGSSLRLRVNSIGNLSAGPSALGNPTTAANGLIVIGNQSQGSILEFTGLSGNQSTDRQVQVGSSNSGSGGATIQNNDPTYTLTFSNAAFNVAATGVTSFNRAVTLAGSNTGNNTISGTIINNVGTTGGNVGVTKSGAGTWVLSGANTYAGGTTVNAGTLVLANTSAVQNSSGLTIGGASAATLRLATDTAFTTLPQVGGASGAGGTTFVSDRATSGAGLTHALASPNLGANSFNFISGGNVTSGTAGFSLSAVGMTSGTAGTTLLNPTTATLTIVGGVTSQTNDFARTLELGGTGTGHSIGGVITQSVASPLSLTKSDTSTWTLTGASTYSGATTISGGTLLVNSPGSLDAASAVAVNGGTLGGTGTVGGTVTVAAGGSLAPGASPGTLSIGGGLDISAPANGGAGKLNFELDALANPNDQIAVTGTLTIGVGVLGFNDFVFSNLGGLQVTGGTPYKLITSSGITALNTLDPANLSGTLPGGLTGTLQLNGGDVELAVTSGGSTYASWIATYPGVGLLDGVNDDPDNDGIDNGAEMVLGGNPATGMDTALLPTIELVNADPDGDTTFSDYLLFTYRRSDLSVAAGVTADCETDTDMVAPWTAATGAPGVVIQVDDNFTFTPPAAADTDRVRVYVPRGSNTTLFGRLNVVVP